MILVTGATGFVGEEVVGELLKLGARVRLLVRDPRRAARFAHQPQIELVPGDVLQPETLPAALAGVQTVIHLVGFIAETSRVTFEQGHTEATRNLLTAAKAAGVTRWVQMSAIGTRPYASSRYHQTKWQAEELVRHSGLDWTILRPSLIYGYDHRDRLLNMLCMLLSPPCTNLLLHCFPLLDGGRPLIRPVSVREVARCFAHAPAKEASIGVTYDLVGPVAFSWREMVGKVAAALGRKTIYEEIPILLGLRKLLFLAAILVPLAVLIGLVSGWLNLVEVGLGTALATALIILYRRPKPVILFNLPSGPLLPLAELISALAPRELQMSEQLKMAAEDNTGDPLPAARMFGYTPETFEQGVARIVSHKTIS